MSSSKHQLSEVDANEVPNINAILIKMISPKKNSNTKTKDGSISAPKIEWALGNSKDKQWNLQS